MKTMDFFTSLFLERDKEIVRVLLCGTVLVDEPRPFVVSGVANCTSPGGYSLYLDDRDDCRIF